MRKAVPKRTASPAQLRAVAKAIREHQARAAERHGVSRAELTTTSDPGPGWDNTPETTHKEENPMSDTTSQDSTAASSAPRLGIAEGHGQRIAYLLATVAVNRARQRHDKLDADVAEAERSGPDAAAHLMTKLETMTAAAETRLTTNTANGGVSSVAPLADALVFRTGSDVAEQRLDQLTRAYATDWGVRIDADALTVDLVPDFDPVAAQARDEAQRSAARSAAAVDIVTALPLSGTAQAEVGEAISAWHSSPDPENARRQLDIDLAAAKLGDADRARVGFVVDYLRGDVSEVDLLSSPVFVDPGQETRTRIPLLLETFAKNPAIAPMIGREISVMTEEDQQRVRQAGKAIAAGQQIDTDLWPDHADRQTLSEALRAYARETTELREVADYLAEGHMPKRDRLALGSESPTMHDETSARLERLTEARAELLEQTRWKGLASVERAQLSAVVTDIEAGRTELPELLFADEHSKADLDFQRSDRAASELARGTADAINAHLTAANAVESGSREAARIGQVVEDLKFTLGTVANATPVFSIEHKRSKYAEDRAHLGQALTQAGVPAATRSEIRDLLDSHARQAGELGSTATARQQQWDAKTAQVAAERDDALAQRQAADSGRAKPPDAALQQRQNRPRACTARIDQHLTTSPSVTTAGIRQLHEGVER